MKIIISFERNDKKINYVKVLTTSDTGVVFMWSGMIYNSDFSVTK